MRAGRDGRVPLWEIRKPTPDERLSIIANWIRMHGKEGPIAQKTFHLYGERSCSIKSIMGKFARKGKTRNDGRAIKKDILETIVLSDDETGRYIADCIYFEQKKEAPEITSMKKRRSEVEKKIGNFVKAIGMGIVTESTKSALLFLESERSRLDEELSKLSLNSESFSKDEIKWDMNELSAYDIKDPKAKSALLDCFVKKVEIGTKGNITAEYDLFGYETGFTMGSEAFKEVRKNPALLRHYESISLIQ